MSGNGGATGLGQITFGNWPQLAASRSPQRPRSSFDPAEPGIHKWVQKGGSFLRPDHYCPRYMDGTRGKSEPSTATDHAGFRCVKDAD